MQTTYIQTEGVDVSDEKMTDPGDPYGWIAAVERHPDPQEWSHADPEGTNGPNGEPAPATVENTQGEQVPVSSGPYVAVTPSNSLSPVDMFHDAVATVLPNGTLLVTLPGRTVPLKGYAPGSWLTFEHVGADYFRKPVRYTPPTPAERKDEILREDARRRQDRPAVPSEMLDQRGYSTDDVLTHPQRRQPPTLEQDSDEDTADVKSFEQIADERAGVVQGPKARGVRPDAGYDGHPDRPATGAPGETEEKTPGRLRSLWQSLMSPDWSED